MRGDVLASQFDLGRYATDASCYQITPLCVAVPKDISDVEAALDVCLDLAVPILPRGGGTSQCGQTVNRALVLDFSKFLNQVIPLQATDRTGTSPGRANESETALLPGTTIDSTLLSEIRETRQVRVQPGVVLDQLNAALKPAGLWFPVDVSTASRATIGGMTANNSCGSRSIRYGTMRHNVEAVHSLMADGTRTKFGNFKVGSDTYIGSPTVNQLVSDLLDFGYREKKEIRERFPHLLRRVGGYNIDALIDDDGRVNLAHLLVGSEGTLAISESIELNLQPLPVNKTLGVCHFPSFYDAMATTRYIVKLAPVAVELVDHNMIALSRDIPLFQPVLERCVKGNPEALLLVEFAEPDQSENLHRLNQLSELMSELGFHWESPEKSCGGVLKVVDINFQKSIWEVRKQGLNIMMSMKSEGKPISFVEDCAVKLEDLADYTQRLTDIFKRYGTQGTWYAHASVGTLHVRPVLNLKLDQDVKKMRAIAEETFEMVKGYKGSHSGEHGDGIVRSEFHEKMFGQRMVSNFEWVKDRFDPSGIFNPGKIVRAPKMDDRSLFRYSHKYATSEIRPQLDWSDWPESGSGFQGAVEMCNNNGACRKLGDGVMCPSYKVTRNERDLVRGRANSLRLAISGQLGTDALSSDEMMQTMKLCVSCKACRRECPTGVDMSKMKIEVLGARVQKHGSNLHDNLVAYLPHYARWLSRMPWLGNLRNRIHLLAMAMEKVAEFSADRQLPTWRKDYFRDAEVTCSGATPDVVLLADTFNRYFEPENLRATAEILVAAGYSVITAEPPDKRPLCCGRTFLSSGLVDQARTEAKRMQQALLPYARNGVAIVGLEPSCLLTLRDENLNLLPGEDSQLLARQARLLEEFIADEINAGRFSLDLKFVAKKAMLHGHCHQKSFNAMDAVKKTLSLVPELEIENVSSSCCGMAGAFGYHADTITISKLMAELSLLPKVRCASEDTLIVADGTSCRHQISDGSGVQPLHVARVLQLALVES